MHYRSAQGLGGRPLRQSFPRRRSAAEELKAALQQGRGRVPDAAQQRHVPLMLRGERYGATTAALARACSSIVREAAR